MIDYTTEQRSLEWFRARLGHFTGSRIGDLMKAGRKKDETFSETAKAYIYQVAGELMLNPAIVNDDDLFKEYVEYRNTSTKAMRWGTEQEAEARALYCDKYLPAGAQCKEVSLCYHDKHQMFAASPDAVVVIPSDKEEGKETIISLEIKCPNIDTAVRYMAEVYDGQSLKQVNAAYYWQVMAEIACTGAEHGVFIIYCPWLTNPIKAVTIGRDEAAIRALRERIYEAENMVFDITCRLDK